MGIEIKKENYKELLQCLYLGNLILNEYESDGETRIAEFIKSVFSQIISEIPLTARTIELRNCSKVKTNDLLLSDLFDRIGDSLGNNIEKYRNSVFCELLAEKIANRNYPIVENNEDEATDNLLAKELYFKILISDDGNFVHIEAPKICDKIQNLKRTLSDR